MLAGSFANNNNAMPDQDRQDLMANLQKIMDKPIVIQQQIVDAPRKALKTSVKLSEQSINQSNSIRESIQLDNIRELNNDDDDEIGEDIPEEVNPES